jgi:uncharacterized protein (TIRG00374 family)
MENTTMRSVAVKIAQYGIAIIAFAWLLGQIEIGRIVEILRNIGPGTVLALVVVTVFGLVGRFYTWHVLINHIQRTDFLAAASTDLIVNFINQLLPSRLSGRAAAPIVLRSRTGIGYADAVAVSGVHTGLYAVLYGVVSVLGLSLGYAQLPIGLVLLLALSTALYLAAGVVVLFAGVNMSVMNRFVTILDATVRRVPKIGSRLSGLVHRVPEFTGDSARSFRDLLSDRLSLVAYAVGWIGVMVLAPGVRVWLLFQSLGVGFEPVFLLPFYLLTAYSVTLLPLTPGGIGVTEATATVVFVSLGMPEGIVVSVIFIDRALGVYLPALSGWYPSLRLDLSALTPE